MIRVGYGYDVHRLTPGRNLILGGVHIEHPLGLLGHSDADVLLHSIIDALMGAAALGDIGTHFPDKDERFLGADSAGLLSQTARMVRESGFEIGNIDSSVAAERPKLSPYILQMRQNIAYACSIPIDCVSVKATTEEGLGFTGEEKGIAAHAVCSLYTKLLPDMQL